MGNSFAALQRAFQLEYFFVESGNQHGQPVLFLGLAGQPHFCVVELKQEEEREDEETPQNGNQYQPHKHPNGEGFRLLVGDGIHGRQFADAGKNLRDNRPKGNAQSLLVDGFTAELGQSKEQGVDKIVEEIGNVLNEGQQYVVAVEHIEPRAEQHNRAAGNSPGKETGECAEPDEEQQKHRRAEADAKSCKISAEGVHLRFACQGNQYNHKEQHQPVLPCRLAIIHRKNSFEKFYI